jgi:hypothetical protein
MAREALTEAARERHSTLAEHFAGLAERAQTGDSPPRALAIGRD